MMAQNSAQSNLSLHEEYHWREISGIYVHMRRNSLKVTRFPFTSYGRNSKDGVWVRQRARPRRNRQSAGMRALVRESIVTPKYTLPSILFISLYHNIQWINLPVLLGWKATASHPNIFFLSLFWIYFRRGHEWGPRCKDYKRQYPRICLLLLR